MFYPTTDSYKKALSYKSKQTFAQRINIFVTILFLQCFTKLMMAFYIDMHTFKDPIFRSHFLKICTRQITAIYYLALHILALCIDHVCTTVEDRNRLGEFLIKDIKVNEKIVDI